MKDMRLSGSNNDKYGWSSAISANVFKIMKPLHDYALSTNVDQELRLCQQARVSHQHWPQLRTTTPNHGTFKNCHEKSRPADWTGHQWQVLSNSAVLSYLIQYRSQQVKSCFSGRWGQRRTSSCKPSQSEGRKVVKMHYGCSLSIPENRSNSDIPQSHLILMTLYKKS